MFVRQSRKLQLFYTVADLALITAALRAAYATRQNLHLERAFDVSDANLTLIWLIAAVAWTFTGSWFGVYERLDGAKPRDLFVRTFRQAAALAVGVVVFEYARRLDLSRPFLGLFTLYAFLAVFAFRLLAGWLLPRIGPGWTTTTYVLIAGTNLRALEIARLIEEPRNYGLTLIGFLAASEAEARAGLPGYPAYPISRLPDLLSRHVVDEIIFAVGSARLPEFEEAFLLCEEEGVRTRLSLDFFPHLHSRVSLDRLGAAPLLTFYGAPHDEIRLWMKRLTDIVVAARALLLAAPLMLLISILIRLTSKGGVFFPQERCGLNGRRFTMWKFRTMVENASAMRKDLEHLNVKKTAFKIPNDPRITGLGRWLRKFSIDEWPQLWNVLRGEMSLVGPRPAVPEEVEEYKRWQRRRLRMRPGLTCLWTLAGRDAVDFEEWMKLDLTYIDNWSLALDWRIIFRTIPHVVMGKGAH